MRSGIENKGLRFLVAEQMWGEEFQSHGAVELGVVGLVDDAHPAFAEFFGDLVVRDGLADHGRFQRVA